MIKIMKTRVPVNLWNALYYKTDPAVRQAFNYELEASRTHNK